MNYGLKDTHFETPHGLDSDNHYTTAYELALLSNYAMNNKTFANIVNTKTYTVTINGSPKNINNTNELLGNLNGVYGIKTGFTNGANRCLVSCCKRGDMDIICVVLGADTKNFRTRDSIKLIEYTFKNFDIVNIKSIMENEFLIWKDTNIDGFLIEKGVSNNICIKMGDMKYDNIPLLKDDIPKINIEIECQKLFVAPLPSGSIIGSIFFNINDNVVCKCDIVTEEDVKRKNVLDYLFSFFIGKDEGCTLLSYQIFPYEKNSLS